MQNGDNITAVYSCSASVSSPAGTYLITPSLVDPNNSQTNYTVNLVNGALTVLGSPVIQPAGIFGDSFTFAWSAIAGQPYQIQSATGLDQSNWSNLGGVFVATGSTITASEPIGAGAQQFFRVLMVP